MSELSAFEKRESKSITFLFKRYYVGMVVNQFSSFEVCFGSSEMKGLWRPLREGAYPESVAEAKENPVQLWL